MSTSASLLAKPAGFLLIISAALPALGQGILIDSITRNGSFEAGVLAPWGSGHDVQVLQDAVFASDGDYYASFQSSSVRPVLAGQTLLPNPGDGLLFLLSFDARLGTPGLDVVSPSLGGRTPEGQPLDATVTPLVAPPLIASAWQRYEYELQLPTNWDSAGIHLGISFNKNQALGGITHITYLDNVVLQQVPEPSTLALLFCGSVLLAGHWLRRFRTRK